MYTAATHQQFVTLLRKSGIDIYGNDHAFFVRCMANVGVVYELFYSIYHHHTAAQQAFEALLKTVIAAYQNRPASLLERDTQKTADWFLSEQIVGMSLYVDRFCGNLKTLPSKLSYFEQLGVNFLHLMPLFESPEKESDGGYAVSNFRKVDERFGTLEELIAVQQQMQKKGMYLMLDIVLNHTSHLHEWAMKAKAGNAFYKDFFYTFTDRTLPDQFDATMPEIFPESAPGNFTYNTDLKAWVMTVFHQYQWDLNYSNPNVLVAMLDTIFFYANIGVDVLRIDAPAFIWKQLGTTCQNLPQAHTLLRLIKHCVQMAAPGMALLGEAIVAPDAIMKYFGEGTFTARECDVAYNATHMALQWDALATGDTRVMLQAQPILLQKPKGTTWLTYTRCHDDIGLGYDDTMIAAVGFNPYEHRKFLKNWYSGMHPNTYAKGALFSVNPKTQDARISGTLASLCGLENALLNQQEAAIQLAIQRIVVMQAHSLFLGGIPMLFYGDEVGYTNDYSYLHDAGKSYDNRWMHRPVIDWKKNDRRNKQGTIEQQLFTALQQLITLRKQYKAFADYSNLIWLTPHNKHIAGFVRQHQSQTLFCFFNFSSYTTQLTWYVFKELPQLSFTQVKNIANGNLLNIGADHEHLVFEPYGWMIFEGISD